MPSTYPSNLPWPHRPCLTPLSYRVNTPHASAKLTYREYDPCGTLSRIALSLHRMPITPARRRRECRRVGATQFVMSGRRLTTAWPLRLLTAALNARAGSMPASSTRAAALHRRPTSAIPANAASLGASEYPAESPRKGQSRRSANFHLQGRRSEARLPDSAPTMASPSSPPSARLDPTLWSPGALSIAPCRTSRTRTP